MKFSRAEYGWQRFKVSESVVAGQGSSAESPRYSAFGVKLSEAEFTQ